MIGPRGTGKSVIIQHALSRLHGQHQFYEIRLNGSIHTDDRSTIKAIINGLSLGDDDDEIDLSNYVRLV
jgi:ABC-type phosphate transport system ATPase subunit